MRSAEPEPPSVRASLAASRIALLRTVDAELGLAGEDRDHRTGRRLAALLERRGGIHLEIGAQLARRGDLLPDGLRAPLATYGAARPACSFEEIRAELRRVLGPLLGRFAWIDPVPIEAGGFAQIHRARLVGGPIVAVKVRRPEATPWRLDRDLKALGRRLRLLRPWLGGRPLAPLLPELGRGLHAELDFEQEALAADALAASFRDDPRIVVPTVHWGLSAPSVLTLDHVPRIPLDDHARVQALGIEVRECLALVLEAYGRQVLERGRFHTVPCRPSPGSVFVVDEADPRAPAGGEAPRILFADFGLRERLPEALRLALRWGLQGVLARDVAAVLESLQRVEAVRPGREALAAEVVGKALGARGPGVSGRAPCGIEALRALGRALLRESRTFRLPSELLSYGHTLAYVTALARAVDPRTDPGSRLLPHLMKFLSGS